MMKVKICGLMTPSDVAAVNTTSADFAGFVFAPGRHQITAATAQDLRQQLHPEIQTVGVFVHESINDILAIYRTGAIQIAQLHGGVDNEKVQALQAAGMQVIQVFVQQAIAADSPADYVMVDSGQGSGQTIDWSPLPTVHQPTILAGGLTPANVATAIQITRPAVVDVSSGVETDHHKDIQKIQAFVTNAKGAV
ncbi:MAG: phosphoribosylanthranilate isomerase [Schleiferilactobacillus harbinensis]|jgi:phosphoribosylanthranilate isomerase|nr:phosphoribosylanthranilate isomerase [Schleiferilactobacillus harbinensis]MCI1913450.1 phosphoribosylanthranilate isomerase [Schleiferilactobacillus harbinensis]